MVRRLNDLISYLEYFVYQLDLVYIIQYLTQLYIVYEAFTYCYITIKPIRASWVGKSNTP